MPASDISIPLKRKDVLRKLFDAATFGNLGIFIGAGFSKAVVNTEAEDIALSWGELLRSAASIMEIDLGSLIQEGQSYPELASKLCATYAQQKSVTYDEAKLKLKNILSDETAWFPSGEVREKFSKHLKRMAPSWIATTNYDQVLECLLAGRCISLGPHDAFSSPRGVIPILHLHGSRAEPKEIIITQEDYVSLFRPTEYRQVRLALTIRESTTCLIGYGLGDVNVQAALDWSKNVYPNQAGDRPHEVVQLLWNPKPIQDPYRSNQGVLILEIESIESFFDEYRKHRIGWRKKLKKQKDDDEAVRAMLAEGKSEDIAKFIKDADWRKSVFESLTHADIRIAASLEVFLKKCFAETRIRSSRTNAFEEYGVDLGITIDLLTALPLKKFPTALLPVLVQNFNRLSMYIGYNSGDSWAAAKVWDKRKSELSDDMVREMLAISKQYLYTYAQNKLKGLTK